ncbi:MAG: Trk system potassium transporter TrkA [Verrucomicrobiota bacterium]
MKIIISGIGEVGSHLASLLVEKGHEIVLIDYQSESVASLEEHLDARIVIGSATSATLLKEAGIDQADLFLALTSDDEVNLVACSLAKALGAKEVVARYHAPARKDHQVISYSRHFGIDYLVSPERLAASTLAREIRSPLTPVIDQFARGSIEVAQITLDGNSDLLGIPLNELTLPARVRVGIIQRGEEIQIPSAREVLKAGDRIILVGSPQGLTEAVRKFEGTMRLQKQRIVLYGAEDIGTALIENFTSHDIEMKVIEPKRERCEWISEHYPWVQVIEGDAIHSRLMIEENVMEADVFIAATRDDENNVMACLQAAKLGIRPCLLVIHRPDYAGIMADIGDILGVNQTVSPRLVTGHELLRFVTEEPYMVLWEMPNKKAQIIRIRLQAEDSPLYRKLVRELKWPSGTMLLGIERSDNTTVPSAEDRFHAHDSLLLLTRLESRDALIDLFRPAF